MSTLITQHDIDSEIKMEYFMTAIRQVADQNQAPRWMEAWGASIFEIYSWIQPSRCSGT
jgi:hypothetical protein